MQQHTLEQSVFVEVKADSFSFLSDSAREIFYKEKAIDTAQLLESVYYYGHDEGHFSVSDLVSIYYKDYPGKKPKHHSQYVHVKRALDKLARIRLLLGRVMNIEGMSDRWQDDTEVPGKTKPEKKFFIPSAELLNDLASPSVFDVRSFTDFPVFALHSKMVWKHARFERYFPEGVRITAKMSEMAEKTKVSTSTVSNYCKALEISRTPVRDFVRLEDWDRKRIPNDFEGQEKAMLDKSLFFYSVYSYNGTYQASANWASIRAAGMEGMQLYRYARVGTAFENGLQEGVS